MSEKHAGFRLFHAPYYQPAQEVLPADAVADSFDRADTGVVRYARWHDERGREQKIRIVRAEKGKHAGVDLAVFASSTWTVEFRDQFGKIRRLAAFSNKSASAEMGRNLVSLVDHHVATGGAVDPKLSTWLAGLKMAFMFTSLP